MSLLNEQQCGEVAEAITRIERDTDAELVTVLAAQADDYRYIPLLWAGILGLLLPGIALLVVADLGAHTLFQMQCALFAVLAIVGRVPAITTRLIPQSVRHWRAANLARCQFLEQNLHHTDGATGMLIFVSEAERYVEILVDRGISERLDDSTWEAIVARFTARVRAGDTLAGFLECIDACGAELHQAVPATHERNELPNRLVVLD